jgi:hypothetical protein
MKAFKIVKTKYFVGNNKSVDYKVLVKEMLQTFQNLKCNLKTFFFYIWTTLIKRQMCCH